MSLSGNGLMSTPLLLSQKLLFITGLWKVMQWINQSIHQQVCLSVCLSVSQSINQSISDIEWIREGLKGSTYMYIKRGEKSELSNILVFGALNLGTVTFGQNYNLPKV